MKRLKVLLLVLSVSRAVALAAPVVFWGGDSVAPGDVVFYVSKTDAWTDNVGGGKGLAKLERLTVTPASREKDVAR